MTQPGAIDKFTGIEKTFVAPPGWVPTLEQRRFQAYNAYDELYWNTSATYRLMMRGGENEEDAIYVPTPRIIIETVNRYIGTGMSFQVDPVTGTPASRGAAQIAFDMLFAREQVSVKYNHAKRFGLVRGDWVFHITADPAKLPGQRISVHTVHPGNYYPIYESVMLEGGSPSKVIGIDLVEPIKIGDDELVQRQRYMKDWEGGSTTITTSLANFKVDEWFDPTKAPVLELIPETPLPAEITAIPVFALANFREDGDDYGSSELRGYERVMAAINQGFTDEDITLALEGLGVYATDSAAAPRDSVTGEVTTWSVYPGRVVQNAQGFRRVEGVSNVTPYGDHIERMTASVKEASGATDAAIGHVDVAVAESGVALLLHLSPILAKAQEYDDAIKGTLDQMWFNLIAWFAAYEQLHFEDVIIRTTFKDKLPKNKAAAVNLVVLLMSTVPPVLSAESARVYLAKEGIDIFNPNEATLVAAEQATVAANADPLGGRVADELAPDDVPAPGVPTLDQPGA